MKSWSSLGLILLIYAFSGCADEEERICCAINEADPLSGSWQLYEHGYSPGAGYVTKPVPEKPAQIITFNDGNIESTMAGFKHLTHYEIKTDATTNAPYMIFYPSDSTLRSQSFSFDLAGTELKLYFRWCIEGCHMAFKKID